MTHSDVGVCADPMQNPFPVLVVSANEEDHKVFDVFLSRVGYTLHHASTLAAAISILQELPVPVIVTERTLPDGSWIGFQVSSDSPCHPPLVIVFSDPGDATFWAQAFNLGAFDVVHRPLTETIVARAINLAHLRWARAIEESDARSANRFTSGRAAPLMQVAPPPSLPSHVSTPAKGYRRSGQRAAASTA